MSIREEIERFSGYKMFCTPGHKGTLMSADITEIDTSFPGECIDKAQKRVAKYYDVPALRFLTAGSSIGVKAALMDGGDLLVQKNSHRSVLDAAELAGARVFFMDNDSRDGLELPPTKQQILAGLERHKSVKTVVLTSPDYYGFVTTADAAEAVVSAGKRLHIDAAHGAHMFFRPELFDLSAYKFAHTFNVSAHKTLPSFTGTAYLCIRDLTMVGDIDRRLAQLGTTSPFYPFLASLEDAAEFVFEWRSRFDELKKAVEALTKRVKTVKNADFSRIVVDAAQLKMSGEQLYFGLKEKGIIAEKFDSRYVIFITTICDELESLEQLADAICSFS